MKKYVYIFQISITEAGENKVMAMVNRLELDRKAIPSASHLERLIFCIKNNRFPYLSNKPLDSEGIKKVENGIYRLFMKMMDIDRENLNVKLTQIKTKNHNETEAETEHYENITEVKKSDFPEFDTMISKINTSINTKPKTILQHLDEPEVVNPTHTFTYPQVVDQIIEDFINEPVQHKTYTKQSKVEFKLEDSIVIAEKQAKIKTQKFLDLTPYKNVIRDNSREAFEKRVLDSIEKRYEK